MSQRWPVPLRHQLAEHPCNEEYHQSPGVGVRNVARLEPAILHLGYPARTLRRVRQLDPDQWDIRFHRRGPYRKCPESRLPGSRAWRRVDECIIHPHPLAVDVAPYCIGRLEHIILHRHDCAYAQPVHLEVLPVGVAVRRPAN